MLEILNDFLKESNYETLNRIQKIELLKQEIKNLLKTAFYPVGGNNLTLII